MNQVMKALIIDDHPLIASATREVLDSMDRIEVIGVVSNGTQCMEQIALHQPGLVFLDYHLPGPSGMAIAAQIRRDAPHTYIVLFTGVDLRGLYPKSIELGISGMLSKEAGPQTIKNMVNCILDGYTMLPLSVYKHVQLNRAFGREEGVLNGDEQFIMSLMVQGATYEQIAEQINTSKRTVENYLRKIYEKLGARSKVEALEKYIKSPYYASHLGGSQ